MSEATNTVTVGASRPGRPARPGAPADYWDRVRRIAASAPPLTDHQRAVIRAAFFQPTIKEAA